MNEKSKNSNPVPQQEPVVGERIAKRMARAGLCSRRDAERWIEAGRVSVNGKLLKTPACVVSDRDRIEVDGAALPGKERTRLWLLNKKSGLVTTSRDPEGRQTVFEALPEELPRVLSVGRLDINTEGLLLLTNDGGLARALELPSTGWLRRYRVRAHGSVNQEALDELKEGIAVDGVLYGSIEAELERQQGSNVWLTFAMREGKNREVKNVLGALGLEVNRLIRISYGPFQLGDLATGQVREVRGRTLRDQLGRKLIEQSGANFDVPQAAKGEQKPAAKKQPDEEKAKAKAKAKARRNKADPLSQL
jgi:23S rRNA pseudouridine2605 synthase